MSGLAGVLAGHVAVDVYRWHAAFDEESVRHTVEHAGWQFGYLDGWIEQSKAEVLAGLGRALNFPDHYGRNLDALADCLTEVGHGWSQGATASPVRGVLLLWDGWGTFARADETNFLAVLAILRDRAAAPDLAPVAVLLRGDGPELPGVVSLD